ncbi:MAG TPA: LDL receptor domain-containing protein [Polyangiaceae bacterium]
MGGRVVLVLVLAVGALSARCGGKSEADDASRGGNAGEPQPETGGTTGTGGAKPAGGATASGGTNLGGGTATGGTAGDGGAGPAGGASASGGTATGGTGNGIPGGFSPDAERIGTAWTSAVVERCRSCNPEGFDGCIGEDGALVPSPFLLICLSQLAVTDAEIAALLARWAAAAESDAAAWRSACDTIPFPSPPPELPASAARCATRAFGCPEFQTAIACDRVAECLSGEDERFCGPIAGAFVCHHGEPVPWLRICDGLPDCEFGEDERTCHALLRE